MLITAEHESLSRNGWEIIPLEVQESVAQSDVLEVYDAVEEEVYVDDDDDEREEEDDGWEEQDVCADAFVEEEHVVEQKGLVG